MYYGPALRGDQLYQLPSGYPAPQPEAPEGTDVKSILQTLMRRRRVLVSIFLIFMGLVVLFTFLTPKTYTANVKLIAGNSNPLTSAPEANTSLPLLNAILFNSGAQSSETYAELLQETPVAQQVIQDLKLPIDSDQLLSRHVQVKPVTNTAILNLSVSWSDPKTAAKIANTFANDFVLRERDLIAGQAGSALDFLSKQMPLSEAAMHKADDELARFQAAHPGVYLATGGANQTSDSAVSAAQQKFALVQVDAGQAQAQLANAESQLRSVSTTINGSSSVNQNPVVAQLQTQLAQVEVQLEAARKQFTEQHPTVIGLEQQRAQLQKEIGQQPSTIVAGNSIVPNPIYQQLSQQAATLRTQIAADQAQMAQLRAQMGGTTGSLPRQTMQLGDLQRNAKMAEDVYSALQQKYNEATVAKTAALSDVAIVQPAGSSDIVVRPSLVLNLILGAVLGLILALSGVFVVDYFDNTFKDEKDVQRAFPLPLLTSVPQLEAKKPNALPWLRALTIESFMQLVTALRYSSDKPLRTLAVTSPNQGDGKSTVALSTAIAMAEMEPGVVLVDADMRRPMLHTRLGLENEAGLSDYLIGAAHIDGVLQATKYDGLAVVTSGAHVPNPIKLLQSERLDEFINELLARYRVIVFDTPALLAVYDAAVLAPRVDGAVMVVSAGTTDMPSTKKALQRVTSAPGVNMLGLVLNRAAATNGYSSYYLNGDTPKPLPHEAQTV